MHLFDDRNVHPDDEGIYKCTATNEGGSTVETVSLRIQGRYISLSVALSLFLSLSVSLFLSLSLSVCLSLSLTLVNLYD